MSSAITPIDAFSLYLRSNPEVTRYCIAYSGGMDSHALLHAAAKLLDHVDSLQLRAVHIDHGLQFDSHVWVEHCEAVCRYLDVQLEVREVSVMVGGGDGPEANARLARYSAFAELLHPGEHLLLAQHADDQAETFLLQALRGSGPDGLASIPRQRAFARGVMARPLLGCTQEAVMQYAKEHSLQWIDDPSNTDSRFDRNFLREEILPLLKSRWPAASQTLSRAAARSAAASQTLLTLAQLDLDRVRIAGAAELSVSELKALPRERAYNALRLWVRQAGFRMPRLQDLAQVMRDLIRARDDSAGLVNAREYEFRRYGDRIYLMKPLPRTVEFRHEWHAPFDELHIPEIDLTLTREGCAMQGLSLPQEGHVLIRNREPGDLIKLGDPPYHKAVKKLMQEASVPPWERESIPLLYIDERLAAVWNIAVAVDARLSENSPSEADSEVG